MFDRIVSRSAALLLVSAVCAQQELWVEPVTGSDGNPGTFTMPLQTLRAAVVAAGPGARIHLQAGVYSTTTNGETFPINIGFVPQAGLVVRGLGDVVFDLGGATNTIFNLAGGATGARLTHLTIRNTAQTDPQGNNWWVRVFNSGTGVNSGNPALGVEIDRCRLEHVNRGFVLWTSDNVTGWQVHDNLFVDCANDAILEYTGTNDFYNNTFYQGGWKAFISDSATSRFHNNLISNYNIAFEGNNTAATPAGRIEGNLLYQVTTVQQGAGLTGVALPGSNQIGVNPLLVNPTAGDYHLQAGSPAIDAGVLGTFARADLDANSRIVDGDNDGALETDIGCYEVTPFAMTAAWDPLNTLVSVDAQCSVPGSFGIVAFCLDDGVVNLPGQGPILIDLATWVPVLWVSALPNQLYFPISPAPPPGSRLVMYLFGLVPGQVGGAFVGGNQVWLQL